MTNPDDPFGFGDDSDLDQIDDAPETWNERPETDRDNQQRYDNEKPPHHNA